MRTLKVMLAPNNKQRTKPFASAGAAQFAYIAVTTACCIAVAAPVGAILLILAVIGSVLLTEVNDIRFGTVLLSLDENIDTLGGM